MPSLLSRLLAESVRQWCVPARVSVDGQGAVRVTCLGREIIVERAASGSPFRWMVTVEGGGVSRRRPALSVVSVLRQVRLELDPAYEKQRIRVVPPVVGVA